MNLMRINIRALEGGKMEIFVVKRVEKLIN